MNKVNVMNACGCFLKSDLNESTEYETRDEAQKEAQKLLQKMESSFCQKHQFSLIEQFGDFVIYIKPKR